MIDKEVLNLVEAYKSLPSDYQNISELIDLRKDLSISLVYLAKETGEARAKWKRSAMNYELEKNALRIDYIADGTQKADWKARANTMSVLSSLTDSENDYYSKDYLLRYCRDLLGEMSQRIAIARKEYEESNFNG